MTTKEATMMLAELAESILDSACPNGGTDGDNGIYHIEVHCVRWTVTASKDTGQWVIKKAAAEPW